MNFEDFEKDGNKTMAITTEMIKQLRDATGAGILDCRKALEQSNGDYEKAVDYLREKGLAQAAKRSDRTASEGVIEVYSHGNGRVAVVVEVNCESDFVAREASFRAFAHELALQIAASSPRWVKEEDIPEAELKREADIAAARAREEGKPEAVIPRIVEGYLSKFKDETVLMRQKYIRDESKTIQDLYNELAVSLKENIVVRRFVRWELGEASS
ncbi:elongation factor Ts [Anaerolinea thermophila UNI-1]|uniref:Elongation factor Ts n=2 Tax=Anaerolinea thermophila TaxID=167964 RepID=E8N2X8_ANATU|nr:elongation factor Ts [Anaerolinea thermophila UNI-1]